MKYCHHNAKITMYENHSYSLETKRTSDNAVEKNNPAVMIFFDSNRSKIITNHFLLFVFNITNIEYTVSNH